MLLSSSIHFQISNKSSSARTNSNYTLLYRRKVFNIYIQTGIGNIFCLETISVMCILIYIYLPPWQRRLCFLVALVSLSVCLFVCLFVCLTVDNITQKIMNGLG